MSEHEIQVALFQWAAWGPPELAMMFAIPNQGVGRNKRLQMEGAKAGVPDIFLAVPRGPQHGMFIELKAGKTGRLSDHQIEWADRLRKHGYYWQCCRSFEEAQEKILDYLKYD